MKYHICGFCAALQVFVQDHRRQKLNSYVLKSPLLAGHVMHDFRLVLTRCGTGKTNHLGATDGAVAHKLRRYQVTLD